MTANFITDHDLETLQECAKLGQLTLALQDIPPSGRLSASKLAQLAASAACTDPFYTRSLLNFDNAALANLLLAPVLAAVSSLKSALRDKSLTNDARLRMRRHAIRSGVHLRRTIQIALDTQKFTIIDSGSPAVRLVHIVLRLNEMVTYDLPDNATITCGDFRSELEQLFAKGHICLDHLAIVEPYLFLVENAAENVVITHSASSFKSGQLIEAGQNARKSIFKLVSREGQCIPETQEEVIDF